MSRILEDYLEDYNQINTAQMKLVLFLDAVRHVCRIARIIRQPLGNALLLGVGGSGRQSLTRLAAHMSAPNSPVYMYLACYHLLTSCTHVSSQFTCIHVPCMLPSPYQLHTCQLPIHLYTCTLHVTISLPAAHMSAPNSPVYMYLACYHLLTSCTHVSSQFTCIHVPCMLPSPYQLHTCQLPIHLYTCTLHVTISLPAAHMSAPNSPVYMYLACYHLLTSCTHVSSQFTCIHVPCMLPSPYQPHTCQLPIHLYTCTLHVTISLPAAHMSAPNSPVYMYLACYHLFTSLRFRPVHIYIGTLIKHV